MQRRVRLGHCKRKPRVRGPLGQSPRRGGAAPGRRGHANLSASRLRVLGLLSRSRALAPARTRLTHARAKALVNSLSRFRVKLVGLGYIYTYPLRDTASAPHGTRVSLGHGPRRTFQPWKSMTDDRLMLLMYLVSASVAAGALVMLLWLHL